MLETSSEEHEKNGKNSHIFNVQWCDPNPDEIWSVVQGGLIE